MTTIDNTPRISITKMTIEFQKWQYMTVLHTHKKVYILNILRITRTCFHY
jgi:hypothetical protein